MYKRWDPKDHAALEGEKMRRMAKRIVPAEERPVEFREMCDRLNATMERLGLSGRKLSERSGVDRRIIDRFSKGERLPDVPNLLAIAKGLGVAPWWLLVGDGAEEPFAQVLSGFLDELDRTGLRTWAARQPREAAPTIADATAALADMHAARERGEPFFTRTDGGEKVILWGDYFAAKRAGKPMRTPSNVAMVGEPADQQPDVNAVTVFPDVKRRKK